MHATTTDMSLLPEQPSAQDSDLSSAAVGPQPLGPATSIMQHLSTLRIYSCNSAAMDKEGLPDLLVHLRNISKGWDVVCIQEGPTQDHTSMDIVDGGHLWCVAARSGRPRSVAILMHKTLVEQAGVQEFRGVNGRVAFADISFQTVELRSAWFLWQ